MLWAGQGRAGQGQGKGREGAGQDRGESEQGQSRAEQGQGNSEQGYVHHSGSHNTSCELSVHQSSKAAATRNKLIRRAIAVKYF